MDLNAMWTGDGTGVLTTGQYILAAYFTYGGILSAVVFFVAGAMNLVASWNDKTEDTGDLIIWVTGVPIAAGLFLPIVLLIFMPPIGIVWIIAKLRGVPFDY